MKALKQNGWRIILALIVGIFLDMMAHKLLPSHPILSVGPYSLVIQTIGFEPTVVLFFVVVFSVLLTLLVLIQNRLPGSRLTKGLRYGASLGLLWFMASLEVSPIKGSPLDIDILWGMADGIPVFLMCLLLALISANQPLTPAVSPGNPHRNLALPVLVFAFLAGRYFAYSVVQIESGYLVRPLETFLWTALMGLVIGVSYWLLQAGLWGQTPFRRALAFSVILFGLNWWGNILFIPLIMGSSFLEMTLRIGIDVSFVLVGVWVLEHLSATKTLAPLMPPDTKLVKETSPS